MILPFPSGFTSYRAVTLPFFDAFVLQHPGLVKRIKRVGGAGTALCRCPRKDDVFLQSKKRIPLGLKNFVGIGKYYHFSSEIKAMVRSSIWRTSSKNFDWNEAFRFFIELAQWKSGFLRWCPRPS